MPKAGRSPPRGVRLETSARERCSLGAAARTAYRPRPTLSGPCAPAARGSRPERPRIQGRGGRPGRPRARARESPPLRHCVSGRSRSSRHTEVRSPHSSARQPLLLRPFRPPMVRARPAASASGFRSPYGWPPARGRPAGRLTRELQWAIAIGSSARQPLLLRPFRPPMVRARPAASASGFRSPYGWPPARGRPAGRLTRELQWAIAIIRRSSGTSGLRRKGAWFGCRTS